MAQTTEQAIREFLDRQEILDCIHRYCRGVDRLDAELLASAYHPTRSTTTASSKPV